LIFFQKKQFLIDLFKDGIVDIHNHLLPGLDDGASTMDDTIDMIALMKTCHIKNSISTPHIMEDFYDLDIPKIEKVFKDCNNKLSGGIHGTFLRGFAAEYMIDQQFIDLMSKREFTYLKDKLLLTELSYFQKPASLVDTIFDLKMQGINPILAHPERYRYMSMDLEEFKSLKEKGMLFQLNLLSISGYYGKDAFAKAKLLLENDMYDFVGTDAHRSSHLNAIQEITVSKQLIPHLTSVLNIHRSEFN
jgi:protein-tyrosine phosphatase